LNPELLKTIRQVLGQNRSVVFAYLYGLSAAPGAYNDIDIAVYSAIECDPFSLSADLKITLAEKTGKSLDTFDVRVINHLLRKGGFFAMKNYKFSVPQGVENDYLMHQFMAGPWKRVS